MRFDSSSVMGMLQRLEQVETRPHAAKLTAALSFGGYQQAVQYSGTLHQALGVIEEIKGSLSAHVVPVDGLGEPGDCLGELAIRSRATVIVDQVGQMCERMADPGVRSRAAGWFIGKFRHIESVASFVQDELHRVHGIWKPYRPITGDRDQSTLHRYRVTVRLAQRALEELSDEPDFAHFLTCAMSANEFPELCSAGRCIAAALAIRIDMEQRHAPGRTREPGTGSHVTDAWSSAGRRTIVRPVQAVLRVCFTAVRWLARICLRMRTGVMSRQNNDIGDVKRHRARRQGPFAQ